LRRNKARPQQQIFRRISAKHLLWQRAQRYAFCEELVTKGNHALDIGVGRTDGGVDVGQAQSQ
jgi:hypothetical protein